jgi:PadR family transcriptional regulator AphA
LSSDRLSPFSFAILVLVGRGGAGPHDLRRMAEAGRLAALGYLEARTEPGRTRPRTHYTLTEKGRHALAEWVRTPTGLARMQQEPIVRLLAADLVAPDAVLEGLRPLRAEIEDARRRVADRRAQAGSIGPDRARLLDVNHGYALRLLDLQLEWLDEAERILQDPT